MFWDEMQGDNLPAKVALAGCAQYASEYARDLLTMEGSKDKPCTCYTHSNSKNFLLQSLLVEITALPSIPACALAGDKAHIQLHVRVELLCLQLLPSVPC